MLYCIFGQNKCAQSASSFIFKYYLPSAAVLSRQVHNWDKHTTTSLVCSALNWIQACKIHEKATVGRWFETSRAELERFQTGAAASPSQQEAVGEAGGVCGGSRGWTFYGYCIILSSWELVLICSFLLGGEEMGQSRRDKWRLQSKRVCVCVCV